MIVIMVLIIVIMMVFTQQPCAEQIYAKTNHRDRDRLIEADRHGSEYAGNRLVADEQGDERQNDGARKSRQLSHLAGAKRKAWVMNMRARIPVGKRCDSQGG